MLGFKRSFDFNKKAVRKVWQQLLPKLKDTSWLCCQLPMMGNVVSVQSADLFVQGMSQTTLFSGSTNGANWEHVCCSRTGEGKRRLCRSGHCKHCSSFAVFSLSTVLWEAKAAPGLHQAKFNFFSEMFQQHSLLGGIFQSDRKRVHLPNSSFYLCSLPIGVWGSLHKVEALDIIKGVIYHTPFPHCLVLCH